MAGWCLVVPLSASGAFWDQLADQIGMTSTRQILGQCCSESMQWWWSRARLMRSPAGRISWPWREWCKGRHISRAQSHWVWHSGLSGCKTQHRMKEGERPDLCECTCFTQRLYYVELFYTFLHCIKNHYNEVSMFFVEWLYKGAMAHVAHYGTFRLSVWMSQLLSVYTL